MKTTPLILLAILLLLAACAPTTPTDSGDNILAPLPKDSSGNANSGANSSNTAVTDPNAPALADALAENSDLVFLVGELNRTGLWDDVQSMEQVTLFAPSNAAFSRLGVLPSQIDVQEMEAILRNHLVSGVLTTDQMSDGQELETAVGQSITLQQAGTKFQVNQSPLISSDIHTSNGVIHIIDGVLLPLEETELKSLWGTLASDGRFTILTELLQGSENMPVLRFSDATDAFLAPTDDAFAALPPGTIDYLRSDQTAREYLIQFLMLTPDGWPRGVPLTVADIVEMAEIPTRVPIGGSGFGSGFEKLPVTVNGDQVTIGSATIIEGDMPATNGVIHVLDAVPIPQIIQEHLP